jgi:predicted permease
MNDVVLAAAFGAFLQEVLHLAEQRSRLNDADLRSLLSSLRFWFFVPLMIFVSGVAAYFWFHSQAAPSAQNAMIFGAALPALFKKAVVAASGGPRGGSGASRELGDHGLGRALGKQGRNYFGF